MSITKIGILDFGIRPLISLPNSILSSTINEALTAERLGFHRVWYAEHYSSTITGWTSADMLVSIVASRTNTIHVGPAGSLIRYYPPLKLVSDYTLLADVFPGRIDLGFSKGSTPGIFDKIFKEFNLTDTDKSVKVMTLEKIERSIDLFNNAFYKSNNGKEFYKATVKPDLWNLVTSSQGYLQSLSLGINCSRSLFHVGRDNEPKLDVLMNYKEDFYKLYSKEPKINIAVAGTCQKSHKKAEAIMNYYKKYPLYGIDYQSVLFGTPSEIYEKLSICADKYGVDEVMFLELGITDDEEKLHGRYKSRI